MLMADRIIPLTPGPGATLGPSFAVHLDRPRDHTELNHDPEFRELRNSILTYLTALREEHRSATKATAPRTFTLPDLKPVDLRYR
jgi:nitrate/nitrite transport system ATP-binding protein